MIWTLAALVPMISYLIYRLEKLERQSEFIDGSAFRSAVRIEMLETFISESAQLDTERKAFAERKFADFIQPPIRVGLNETFEAIITEKRRYQEFEYRNLDGAIPAPITKHEKDIPSGYWKLEQNIISKLASLKKQHPDMLPDWIVTWPQFAVEPLAFLVWFVPDTVRLFQRYDRPIPAELNELAREIRIDIATIKSNDHAFVSILKGRKGPYSKTQDELKGAN